MATQPPTRRTQVWRGDTGVVLVVETAERFDEVVPTHGARASHRSARGDRERRVDDARRREAAGEISLEGGGIDDVADADGGLDTGRPGVTAGGEAAVGEQQQVGVHHVGVQYKK